MADLPTCVDDYLSANDFSHHTVKAIKADLRKFVLWFSTANGERFDPVRVTVRDIADFRTHLSNVRRQSVVSPGRLKPATVGRVRTGQWLFVSYTS